MVYFSNLLRDIYRCFVLQVAPSTWHLRWIHWTTWVTLLWSPPLTSSRWVVCLIQASYVPHPGESCTPFGWLMHPIQMIHVPHPCEACASSTWVISHPCESCASLKWVMCLIQWVLCLISTWVVPHQCELHSSFFPLLSRPGNLNISLSE